MSEADACVADRPGVLPRQDKWPYLSDLWKDIQRQEPAPAASPSLIHPHWRETSCLPQLSLPNQPKV